MSEHTSGPWRYEQIATCGAVYQGSDYRMEVCRVNGRDGEQQANARLFASAPQLLEACEGVLGNSTHRGRCIFCGARIGEEHAECCPTIPLRKSIRAAREG